MDQLQDLKDPYQELQKKLQSIEKRNIDLQETLTKLQAKHSKVKILFKNQKDEMLKKSQELENEISKGKKLRESALIIENTNKSLFDMQKKIEKKNIELFAELENLKKGTLSSYDIKRMKDEIEFLKIRLKEKTEKNDKLKKDAKDFKENDELREMNLQNMIEKMRDFEEMSYEMLKMKEEKALADEKIRQDQEKMGKIVEELMGKNKENEVIKGKIKVLGEKVEVLERKNAEVVKIKAENAVNVEKISEEKRKCLRLMEENKEKRREIENFNLEIQGLNDKISRLEEKTQMMNRISAENHDLAEKLNEQKEKIIEKIQENDKIIGQNEEINRKLSIKTQDVKNLKGKIKMLEEQIEEMRGIKEENTLLCSNVEKKTGKCEELTALVMEKDRKCEILMQAGQALQEKVTFFQIELNDLDEIKEQNGILLSKLAIETEKSSDLSSQLDIKTKESELLNRKLHDLSTKMPVLESEANKVPIITEQNAILIENLRNQTEKSTILSSQLTEKTTELYTQKQEIDKLLAKILILEDQLQKQTEENSKTQAFLQDSENAFQKTQQKSQQLEISLQKITTEYHQKSLEAENLSEIIKNLQQKVQKNIEELGEKELFISKIEKSILEKTIFADEMQEKAQKLTEEYSGTFRKLEILTDNNINLRQELHIYEEKEKERQEIFENLRKATETALETEVSLCSFPDFSSFYYKILEKYINLERNFQVLEKKIEESEEKASGLCQELHKEKENIEKLTIIIKEQQESIESIQSAYSECQNLIEAKENSLFQHKSYIETLSSKLKNKKNKLKNLGKSAQTQIQHLEDEKKALQSLIESLQAENYEEKLETNKKLPKNIENLSITSENQSVEVKSYEEIGLITENLKEEVKKREDFIEKLGALLDKERKKTKAYKRKYLQNDKKYKERENLVIDLRIKLDDEEKKTSELIVKMKEVQEIAEKTQTSYQKIWNQQSKSEDLNEKVALLENTIFKLKDNYNKICSSLHIFGKPNTDDIEDYDDITYKIQNQIDSLSSSSSPFLRTALQAKEQQLSQICALFSIKIQGHENVVTSMSSVKQELVENQNQISIFQDLVQQEKKRNELLVKDIEKLKEIIGKNQKEHGREIKSLLNALSKQSPLIGLPSEISTKLAFYETSTQDLNEKVEFYKAKKTELETENNELKEKIREIGIKYEQLEKEFGRGENEILEDDERNDVIKNLNKNIQSARNEINMWKKCFDDKNEAIQNMKNQLKDKDMQIEELINDTQEKFKGNNGQDTEKTDLMHLSHIIKIKDQKIKKLKEFKVKWEDSQTKTNENIESFEKDPIIYDKKIASLENEVKRLKDELKASVQDRENMLEWIKKLKNDEFKSFRANEDAKNMLQQMRDEKKNMLVELIKDNEQGRGGKSRIEELLKKDNVILRIQVEKLSQELRSAQKRDERMDYRRRESSESTLHVGVEKETKDT